MGKRILIVDPVPFGWRAPYVLGPYNRLVAWLLAHWIVWKNPWAEVTVTSSQATVMQGDRVLYQGR